MIPIIPNVFTGPTHPPTPSPIASVTAVMNQIAFHGVLYLGWSFARIGGRLSPAHVVEHTRGRVLDRDAHGEPQKFGSRSG